MSPPFVLLDLQIADDPAPVRQVVGRAARGLGLGATDATRIATAASEIARLAVSLGPARVLLEALPADDGTGGHALGVRFGFDADDARRRRDGQLTAGRPATAPRCDASSTASTPPRTASCSPRARAGR